LKIIHLKQLLSYLPRHKKTYNKRLVDMSRSGLLLNIYF
jgi:hypothetical protein